MSNSKLITVFGATGVQGGGVVKALLSASGYSVRAVTRDSTSTKAVALKDKGCEVVQGNLDDTESIQNAVKGAYGVFLVTNYWQDFDKQKEIDQGKRAAATCKEEGIKHLIYSGLERVDKILGIPCDHFDSKGEVEEYIREQGIPHTILRASFYYQNFLQMFGPKKAEDDGTYMFGIPMEGHEMDGVDVAQFGGCALGALASPDKWMNKTVGITGDKKTIDEYAAILSKILAPKVFKASPITTEEFKAQGFSGAEEIANMFAFYIKGNPDRNLAASKELNPAISNFESWALENKEKFAKL